MYVEDFSSLAEQKVVGKALVGVRFDTAVEACEFLASKLCLPSEDTIEMLEEGLMTWLDTYGSEWDIAGSCIEDSEAVVVGVDVTEFINTVHMPTECIMAKEHWELLFPNTEAVVCVICEGEEEWV